MKNQFLTLAFVYLCLLNIGVAQEYEQLFGKPDRSISQSRREQLLARHPIKNLAPLKLDSDILQKRNPEEPWHVSIPTTNGGLIDCRLVFEKTPNDMFEAWSFCSPEAANWATLTVSEGDQVSIDLRTENTAYSIFSVGDSYVATELEPARILHCDALVPERFEQIETLASRESPDRADGKITVGIFYTQECLEKAGNDLGLLKQIATSSIAKANSVMRNSALVLRFQLVHFGPVSYREKHSFEDMLSDFRRRGDQHLNDVHGIRNEKKIDQMVLFVGGTEGNTKGGLAYIMGLNNVISLPDSPLQHFAPLAFSVVNANQARHDHTLLHELLHNFGCGHDSDNLDSPGLFSYSLGSRVSVGIAAKKYRTVMAYPPGTEIPYVSNPAVYFLDFYALGAVNKIDNAKTIRKTASYVESFRK